MTTPHILAQILDNSKTNLPQTPATQGTLTKGLNILFGVMGALAFLMLVIAGFRYTIAGSDSNKVAEAKRMMAYTIVGLVVIALAATIVNFVLDRV